jgi:hypothetical protein
MANNSRISTLLLGNQIVTATGNSLYVNGVSVGSNITGLVTGGLLPFVAGFVNINSGNFNSQFIQFSQNFNSTPNVIGNLVNNSGDPLIAYNISGASISGFYLNLSDLLTTNNYYFDYLATTGLGFYNFALSVLSTVTNISTTGGGNGFGTITGIGSDGYIPKFTKDGSGIINSVASGSSTGIYISGNLNVQTITVPGANFRITSGQIQFWDPVAYSGNNTMPWRALGVYSGATVWSNPILD